MRVLIYGSKEFAVTVADLARHCGYEVAGFVDDFNVGADIVGSLDFVAENFSPAEFSFAVAIGYANIPARWKAWERIRAAGYVAPALIHPRAYVADNATVGKGCMVMAGAIIDVRAELADLVVVWPGACISHDAKVGRNTFISPNATLCGSSVIGPDTFIGAAAAIADHSQVPASSFIKMNSTFQDGKR